MAEPNPESWAPSHRRWQAVTRSTSASAEPAPGPVLRHAFEAALPPTPPGSGQIVPPVRKASA